MSRAATRLGWGILVAVCAFFVTIGVNLAKGRWVRAIFEGKTPY
jgi:hypothetical protein